MKQSIVTTIAIALLSGGMAHAQSINIWRGNETKADWSDAYKWKLKHAPKGEEAVHFRQPNSVVVIDKTISLNNSMLLYGQELSLEGNGNINFWSPIKNQSTIYIPASASGYANLTLNDNLSVNGRVALAAKAYGTSASKGSVTLKDRSAISGKLSIGNDGSGSGQVFVRDQSTFHISDIELQTQADKGGSAEIHILGGTVFFEKGTNPLEIFLADPSRKIILGDNGTLRIDSSGSIQRKKELIIKMIKNNHLIATPGCQLTPPIFQKNMVTMKAECNDSQQDPDALIAQINQIKDEPEPSPEPSQEPSEVKDEEIIAETTSVPLTGYIVFLGAFLLLLRPAKAT
jgi:hypothetical protein